jgi:hypothetical protein
MNCIKCGANVTVGATKCYNCSHPFNKIETEVVTIPKHQITVLTCENTILTAKVAELEGKLKVADRALELALETNNPRGICMLEEDKYYNCEQHSSCVKCVVNYFKQQAQKEE